LYVANLGGGTNRLNVVDFPIRVHAVVFLTGLVALTLIAAGCSQSGARPSPRRLPSTPPPIAPAHQPVEPIRSFEFEEDPLYQLLIAEFAGQRGNLDLAVQGYSVLAKSLNSGVLARRATRIAVFERDDQAALDAAKIWVELEPKDMEARQIIAAMYIRHGNAEAALAHLEYVLADEATEPGNRLRMIGNLLGEEEDRLTALVVMEQLMEKVGDDLGALFAYTLLAIRAEQLDKARDAMNRIAEHTELSANIVMAYLAVLQKHEKLDEAVVWLKKVLKLNPQQFGLRLILARLLADANLYEEARTHFLLLSEEQINNTDIIFALGRVNLQTNRTADAELSFRRLLELETHEDEAHFYLGQIAESRDQLELAIAQYRSVNGGANYFFAQLRLALALSLSGKVDEGLEHLRNIRVQDDKQRFDLVRARGEMLTEHNRMNEAMAAYDEVLDDGNYNTELLYSRAMLAEKMGRLDLLERDLRTIIKEEPENAQALNALGYTLADRTERYDEALVLITKALVLVPRDFYVLDSMGWVLYRLGRLDEAVGYLKSARGLHNDPEIAAHLGEVLWVIGDEAGARDVWNSVLRDRPNDKKLLDVIKRLAP